MELKECWQRFKLHGDDGLNCTFMELKAHLNEAVVQTFRRLNCTFMELKVQRTVSILALVLGLIVPLWN